MERTPVPVNGMATASIVLGSIAIMTAFIPFLNFLVVVIGPLGIIFGFIAIRQIKQYPDKTRGSGRALTGLLLSVAGTTILLFMVVLILAVSSKI